MEPRSWVAGRVAPMALVTVRARLRVAAVLVVLWVLAMWTAIPAAATPPGDNGRIAYKVYLDVERSTSAIFTMRKDGTHPRQITSPDAGTQDDQPDWSPDGSLIAFQRCAPETSCAIYTVRPDGTGLHRLSAPCDPAQSRPCDDESTVAFLADGHRVVFTRATGSVREFPDNAFIEHSDIVIRDLSGRHARVVLRGRPFAGDNEQMVVSPDGRHIAFVRLNSPLADPAGGIAVFVMRTDGTHLRQLTPWSLRAGASPDWSPDGRWILFRSNVDRGGLDSQLYLIHPDGRGLRAVTDVSADTKLYSASFSPDGRQIVYGRSAPDDLPDLYTVRTDGSGTAPVAVTPGWESSPDWGPR
jgi:TolB protein